jgi:hypothetical protein
MVAGHRSRDELVAGLVRIGQLEMTGEQQDEIDAYFARDFVFHDTDGSTMSYDDLNAYFASLRAAFDNLQITRGIIVVEGDFVSCQTTIEATSFARSPTPRSERSNPTERTSCSLCTTSSATTNKGDSQRSGSSPTGGQH